MGSKKKKHKKTLGQRCQRLWLDARGAGDRVNADFFHEFYAFINLWNVPDSQIEANLILLLDRKMAD